MEIGKRPSSRWQLRGPGLALVGVGQLLNSATFKTIGAKGARALEEPQKDGLVPSPVMHLAASGGLLRVPARVRCARILGNQRQRKVVAAKLGNLRPWATAFPYNIGIGDPQPDAELRSFYAWNPFRNTPGTGALFVRLWSK